MKEKVSVTHSPDLLVQFEHLAGSKPAGLTLIEQVLRRYLRQTREVLQARDRRRINKAADGMNSEALDVLDHQASWEPNPD